MGRHHEQMAKLERRADLRAGLVASLLYNIHRKSGSPAYGPEDFFPEGDEDAEYMTPEESVAAMKAWAMGVNAKLEREAEGDGVSS